MRSLLPRMKVASFVIGIFAGPLALWTICLWLSHLSPRWIGNLGWLGLLLSIGAGVVCILGLPLSSGWRMILGWLFVPAAGLLLLLYGIYFEGVVYGDWL